MKTNNGYRCVCGSGAGLTHIHGCDTPAGCKQCCKGKGGIKGGDRVGGNSTNLGGVYGSRGVSNFAGMSNPRIERPVNKRLNRTRPSQQNVSQMGRFNPYSSAKINQVPPTTLDSTPIIAGDKFPIISNGNNGNGTSNSSCTYTGIHGNFCKWKKDIYALFLSRGKKKCNWLNIVYNKNLTKLNQLTSAGTNPLWRELLQHKLAHLQSIGMKHGCYSNTNNSNPNVWTAGY